MAGAGLAGLACADRLTRAGLSVTVLEASDAVGGRVRTDRVDGFRCDRGFQLLNPAYPAARSQLDLGDLRLQPLDGALVLAGDRRQVLGDPRRTSARLLLPALLGDLAAVGSPREKFAFGRWALRAGTEDASALLGRADEPWGVALDRLGITGELRRSVIRPFLAGVLAEEEGSSSRRFVELLVRSFVRGRPAVPWNGMQAIPEQLAARLPAGTVRTHVHVHAVRPSNGGVRVETDDGVVEARAVVVATDPPTAADLLDLPDVPMRGLTTFWHVAEVAPDGSAALHVDADRRGPVVNSVVLSNAAPSYSPDGRALIASTVLGTPGADTLAAVIRQLSAIYRTDAANWGLVKTHAIGHALTTMDPPLDPRRDVDLGDGVFVAGDHRDTASIQGALVSGRRTAEAVLDRLGVRIPAPPAAVPGTASPGRPAAD